MPVFTSSIEVTADYPTIKPSLNLNFARSRSLDPRVSFTRASNATYVGRDGLIKTAGVDEPRFDHDPVTGESLGLLLETGRTNRAFGTPSAANSTVATGQDNSLTGTNNALLFTKNSGTVSQSHLSFGVNGSVSTTRFVMSVFVKGVNTDTFFMQATSSPVDDNIYIYYNTSTGVTSVTDFTNPSATVTASIEDYHDGWKRLVAVIENFAHSSFNGSQVRIGFSNPANNAQSYQNNTHQALVYGFQVEDGAFPTSYIPTESATGAVTRATERAEVNEQIASGDITICSEYKLRMTSSNQWNRLFGFGEGSSDIRPFINSSGVINFYNYSTEFAVPWPVSQPDFDTPFKFAMAVRQGVANSVVIDGGSVATQSNTNPGAYVNWNELYLGWADAGNNPRNSTGHIKYFRVYNDSLTDAQLQLLTS